MPYSSGKPKRQRSRDVQADPVHALGVSLRVPAEAGAPGAGPLPGPTAQTQIGFARRCSHQKGGRTEAYFT